MTAVKVLDCKVEIRFKHDQIGMTVEARLDAGGSDPRVKNRDWQMVEFRPHGDHASSTYGWGQPSSVMSTSLDEKAYLAMLDKRGIKYVVHSESA